jgi:hypothetical protein
MVVRVLAFTEQSASALSHRTVAHSKNNTNNCNKKVNKCLRL